MKASGEKRSEAMYRIVKQLHDSNAREARDETFKNRSSDPVFRRAMRIHRHLKALERNILEHQGEAGVDLGRDPHSQQVFISIRHDNIRCRQVAYLTDAEFLLLRGNRQVANVLNRCKA